MHNSNTGIFWKMKYRETSYLDPLSSNSEPMETIKNKEPEHEHKQPQESPSKEIINALVFVGSGVLIGAIYYNGYHFNKDLNISNIPLVALIGCLLIMAYLLGLVDTWLKQNIDPYLLKIKSWLNRRNEQ